MATPPSGQTPPGQGGQQKLLNDIDINLHLIAEDDMTKMKDIFDGFKLTVDSLSQSIQTLSGSLSGLGGGGTAGGGRRAGAKGPDPSPLAQSKWAGTRAEMAARMGGIGQYAFGPNISEAERESFSSPRFGQYTTQDFLRMFSHVLSRPGFYDESDAVKGTIPSGMNIGDVQNRRFAVASGYVGSAARALPYMQSGRILIGRGRNLIAQPQAVAMGQNIGASRSGWFGTPFGSTAMTTGLRARWDAAKASWFGLNPNYSSADAQAAQAAIMGMGVQNEDQRYSLQYALRAAQQNTGIGAQQLSELMVGGVRYGSTDVNSMVAAINKIPAAARAAGMSVEQYTSELTGAASQVSSAFGIDQSRTFQQVTAASAASGLSPGAVGASMTNSTVMGIALAQTGGNAYAAMAGPHAGSIGLRAQQTLIMAIAGVNSWSELQRLQDNPQAWQRFRNNLFLMYSSDPSSLGGLTPEQVITMIARPGNPYRRSMATENLTSLDAQMQRHESAFQATGGNKSIDQQIRQIQIQSGMTATQIRQFNQQESGKSYEDRVKRLDDRMKNLNRTTQGDRNRVMIDLTPAAKRLVGVMDLTPNGKLYNTNGGDRSTVASVYDDVNNFINHPLSALP